MQGKSVFWFGMPAKIQKENEKLCVLAKDKCGRNWRVVLDDKIVSKLGLSNWKS